MSRALESVQHYTLGLFKFRVWAGVPFHAPSDVRFWPDRRDIRQLIDDQHDWGEQTALDVLYQIGRLSDVNAVELTAPDGNQLIIYPGGPDAD